MSMFNGWKQFYSPRFKKVIYPYGAPIVQPKAWNRYTQPNGWVYYYHPILRIITPEDIHSTEMVRPILSAAAEHLACMEADGSLVHLPKDWQMSVVLVDPDDEEDPFAIGLHSWDEMGTYTSSEEDGFQKIRVKSDFWEIMAAYPMHRSLPPVAEAEFLSALSHGADESSFGMKSTFPYDGRQIKLILRIYHTLKALRDTGEQVPALSWHIGRVMVEIEHDREIYKFKTSVPRHAIHNQKIEYSLWVRVLDVLLSFFFLGTHKMYRARLQATQPHACPHPPYFQKLMASLLVEWADLNLVAIVFLAAEIAFLTLSAIKDLHRVATLASSLAAMTSIATSLHNVWLHRDKKNAEFQEVYQYLHNGPCGDSVTELNPFDLTLTACTLALPLVLLLWSILGFAVAVGAFSIQGSFQVDRNPFLLVLVIVLGIFPVTMFFAHLTIDLRMLKGDNTIGRVWRNLPWNLQKPHQRDGEPEFA